MQAVDQKPEYHLEWPYVYINTSEKHGRTINNPLQPPLLVQHTCKLYIHLQI